MGDTDPNSKAPASAGGEAAAKMETTEVRATNTIASSGSGGASPARADDIVIGPGVTTSGTFSTGGGLFVDGVLHDAEVESAALSVSRGGEFRGKATVGRLEIAGNLDGEIRASEEVILRATAVVSGKLSSPYIIVHRGATVSGETQTLERGPEAPRYNPPPSLGGRKGRRRAILLSMAFLAVMVSGGGAFALWGG